MHKKRIRYIDWIQIRLLYFCASDYSKRAITFQTPPTHYPNRGLDGARAAPASRRPTSRDDTHSRRYVRLWEEDCREENCVVQ
ncbi:MAG: hypothetical protein GY820_04420 [Gammaproteobacteria bacterium]|nr:hypothetical protein [Gammaproteobacteria bacterium]